MISALVAIALFLNKEAGKAMDMFTKVLGIIMLCMVAFMVVKTMPPVGLALKETVMPSKIDWLTILTLVGGTVGRTDFIGGSMDDMRRSLKRLAQLPDDTVVLPGHNALTTSGAERNRVFKLYA